MLYNDYQLYISCIGIGAERTSVAAWTNFKMRGYIMRNGDIL